MKKIFLFLSVSVLAFLSQAQTNNWDNDFERPLVEVLEDLKSEYSVRIKYDERNIGDFMLKYADWRLVPGDVEVSLKNVLAPFDYTYVKQGEGVYKVKEYQYHLITPEAGAESLKYLSSLYEDQSSWTDRKEELKPCMREALDLSSFSQAKNPKVILKDKRKYKGYTIENLALETVPGLYVTGSVYKPAKIGGKVPVVITPNGHFGDGRYRQNEQLRCAALSKMGAVVVSYDIFGWGESALQVGSKAHRTSMAQTVQTNNALRLLDYLLDQPYADPERVGITGGSGGGSQTMLVSAIDDRIDVSVPVVMTSSFHSGGCPCESGQPIHLCGGKTNNPEIAAMMAPKPMLIISDGQDWTFQVPEVEFPFIERIYGFYEATDKVANAHFPEEGHDYGYSKRKAMYEFMAKYLQLDLTAIKNKSGVIDESSITIEDYQKLYVFDNDPNKLPEGAIKSLEELYEIVNYEIPE